MGNWGEKTLLIKGFVISPSITGRSPPCTTFLETPGMQVDVSLPTTTTGVKYIYISYQYSQNVDPQQPKLLLGFMCRPQLYKGLKSRYAQVL